jgi:hypothetical protein
MDMMGLLEVARYFATPSTTIRWHEGDSHGKGNRVLRPDELPHTVERDFAAMRKGYRVLHADNEIRIAYAIRNLAAT